MSVKAPERMRRHGPIHSLEVCPKCGAYMVPKSDVQGNRSGSHWKHESRHRSFGGVRVQVFSCEACGYTQTHQVDTIGILDEDD